ncbi:hypothetical protein ABR738_19950 [Streptomyces sp. Edi4]|uniref:hypothetical protein n=1 Tax=Streptomyces sp. Edi4 TaxID=3162527 RepID=UPI003305C042
MDPPLTPGEGVVGDGAVGDGVVARLPVVAARWIGAPIGLVRLGSAARSRAGVGALAGVSPVEGRTGGAVRGASPRTGRVDGASVPVGEVGLTGVPGLLTGSIGRPMARCTALVGAGAAGVAGSGVTAGRFVGRTGDVAADRCTAEGALGSAPGVLLAADPELGLLGAELEGAGPRDAEPGFAFCRVVARCTAGPSDAGRAGPSAEGAVGVRGWPGPAGVVSKVRAGAADRWTAGGTTGAVVGALFPWPGPVAAVGPAAGMVPGVRGGVADRWTTGGAPGVVAGPDVADGGTTGTAGTTGTTGDAEDAPGPAGAVPGVRPGVADR